MKQSFWSIIPPVIVALVVEAPPVLCEERPPAVDAKSVQPYQPYSADETTEQLGLLPDGTRASTILSTARVDHDGGDRTRYEVSVADSSGSRLNTTAITISDVVAGERHELDQPTRIAYREALTNLGGKRGEPESSLFQVTAGYSVKPLAHDK